jgi:Zc3h12a-like Ribonuclease NYN domain
MTTHHVVIDGSNIATEGRSTPSLKQLDDAVTAFREEYPAADITVVVDASFEHRIDPAERKRYDKADEKGVLVSPPAGAIGRGDGFLLQIADRTGAAVLSNDSFQEFHGQYAWLFDPGRLIGGKPVPAVGWIFSLRSPVRGAKSDKAMREAKSDGKSKKEVKAAIAEATKTALAPGAKAKKRPRKRGGRKSPAEPSASQPAAVNEPKPFLKFVIDHPIGSKVTGEVAEFSSHGGHVLVDGVRCYAPLAGLGDPPPTSVKSVLKKGETREFVVQAVHAPRRGIDLALPRVAAKQRPTKGRAVAKTASPARKPAAKAAPVAKKGVKKTAAKGTGAKKKAAAKKPAAGKTGAKKAAAKNKKKTASAKKPAKQATAKKPAAGKTGAKGPAKRKTRSAISRRL